jgi:hypothetical protein
MECHHSKIPNDNAFITYVKHATERLVVFTSRRRRRQNFRAWEGSLA